MNTKRPIRAGHIGGLLALLVLPAVPTLGSDAFFHEGSWIQTASFGRYEPVDTDRDISLDDARVGIGYYFLDGLAVVGEAHVSRFDGSRHIDSTGEALEAATSGVGAALIVRWHLLRQKRWSSYLDLGWGLLVTDEDFPPGGTSLNGTSQYGLGLTWRADDRIHIVAGARQLHVSNGKGLVDENPSFDSLGGYLGTAILLGGPEAEHSNGPGSDTLQSSHPGPRTLAQIELQAGEVDDHDYAGARLDLDTRLGDRWWVFLEATGAEISGDGGSGETFTQFGLGLYRRSPRGLLALVVDRQELGVFTTSRLEVQAERYLADRATVVGLVGREDRNLSPDHWRGAVRLRLYPTANLVVEPGLAVADPFEDLDSTSFEPTLNVEYQPPLLARFGLSLFLQDRADDLLLAGIRIAPGHRSELRARHRRGVFQRVRF